MPFIHEDFLLQTKTARRLYHEYARDQPILDYHTHLPARDICENRRFRDLAEIWLEGDHYKWRAMRANGVEERYCTGDAAPYEKFLAWARTVPHTLRNPLYHWTHLELKRYFGIEELLDEATAPSVWARANERLQDPDLTAQGILTRFHVRALCTTDDPTDDLGFHHRIAQSGLATRVYPTFRPDGALAVDRPEAFNAWVDRLAQASDTSIRRLSDFEGALEKRHGAFHEAGCRLSDHGLPHCYADFPSEATAAAIFDRARAGQAAGPEDYGKFTSYLMLFFGRLDARRGWTKQLHLGALRNNNTRAFRRLGPDTGFDSLGDWPQAVALSAYLDQLDQEDALPQIILYNNNPVDSYVFVSMLGNFQGGPRPGRMQFGSAWWFLDTKEGIEWQLNALSNLGLLSRFIGMLTDSRSFMSYPRHEYFRRVLCSLIGRDIENGEMPDDDHLAGPLIENICYRNAKNYLGLEASEGSQS
ncbi:MAG: glucuronate isomerase [Armatimonadetes bacterium]|nr:glucuronate isomerase [Armatimonadota bacterium]